MILASASLRFFNIRVLQRCGKIGLSSSIGFHQLAPISSTSTYRLPSAAELVEKSPEKIRPYLQIMRMDKPTGTWLLFWPSAWSIALATAPGHLPSLYLLGLFGAGSILMRSSGCVINDMWDKDFDKKVFRTKTRPLACGTMSMVQATTLLSVLLSSSLAILLQLNWFSVAVGASSMGLVIAYPLAKRFTYWPQIVLGATINYGALVAWAHMMPLDQFYKILPLYMATACYTVIYDTIYAHQDKADDLLVGIKSTALRFGENTKKWLAGFETVCVGGLLGAGYLTDQTLPYYLAVAATAAHLGWQISTTNLSSASDCAAKFRSNQSMGAILFIGIIVSTLIKTT